MGRRFVIGDIHGCINTLRALIEEQLLPHADDQLYFLGDYIDRGPDSKAVLDYLLALKGKGVTINLLRGNHEQLLLDARSNDASCLSNWLLNGGDATLRSFGIENLSSLPSHYLILMEEMPYYLELPDYVLVHAGLNLALDDPFSDTRFMLWTRHTPAFPHKIHNKTLIHGHTPIPLHIIKHNIENESFIINLDGGCVWRHRPGLGNLCALELNFRTLFVQPNIEK